MASGDLTEPGNGAIRWLLRARSWLQRLLLQSWLSPVHVLLLETLDCATSSVKLKSTPVSATPPVDQRQVPKVWHTGPGRFSSEQQSQPSHAPQKLGLTLCFKPYAADCTKLKSFLTPRLSPRLQTDPLHWPQGKPSWERGCRGAGDSQGLPVTDRVLQFTIAPHCFGGVFTSWGGLIRVVQQEVRSLASRNGLDSRQMSGAGKPRV